MFKKLLSKKENFSVHENNVEKYCRTEQATDSHMAHAHCVQDN